MDIKSNDIKPDADNAEVMRMLGDLLKKYKGHNDITIQLLAEWFDFWKNSDDMPEKMPDSLHTRTLVHIMVYVAENAGKDVVSELRKRVAL